MSSPTGSRARVLIVGGGISGLSAAHRLQELAASRGGSPQVLLVEGDSRLGGQIRTERADGCVFEGGPDSFVSQKPAALALCRRLGLERDLVRPRAGFSRTQVVHRRRLCKLPEGFVMLTPTRLLPLVGSPLFSWRGGLRAACERWVPRRRSSGDESLRSFVTRRFGTEFFERVAEPIIAGLFVADADTQSLEMTMPQLLELERLHGSVSAGLSRARRRVGAVRDGGLLSLGGGLQTLVDRLASELPGPSVITGAAVEHVERDTATATWWVRLAGRDTVQADCILLACPAYAQAEMLRGLDPELAAELSRLEYASCATINLLYRGTDVLGRLENSGFFVPRSERLPILACSYVSAKFDHRAPRDRVLLRAYLGGATQAALMDRSDSELVGLAHESLRELLGIRGRPLLSKTSRFPRSMPQHPVGFKKRASRILDLASRHPGLVLCGGALGVVGLPDCIRAGEQAAERALECLEPKGRLRGPAEKSGLELAI